MDWKTSRQHLMRDGLSGSLIAGPWTIETKTTPITEQISIPSNYGPFKDTWSGIIPVPAEQRQEIRQEAWEGGGRGTDKAVYGPGELNARRHRHPNPIRNPKTGNVFCRQVEFGSEVMNECGWGLRGSGCSRPRVAAASLIYATGTSPLNCDEDGINGVKSAGTIRVSCVLRSILR